MNLQQQLGEWYPLLSHVFETEWMKKLGRRLGVAPDVQPQPENWFRAFQLCSPYDLRVVIIGADPYIRGEADGLAFSSFGKETPSLEVILAEIARTHACPRTQTYLDDWAEQGVLLLNAVLTTRFGQSGAHAGWGWELFTKEVLNVIGGLDHGVIFMLWGKDAQNVFSNSAIKKTTHYPWRILKAHHPQAQNYNPANKFVGCNHFIEANLFLLQHDQWPIWWSDPKYLADENNYRQYCNELLKQIPDVKTHIIEKLRSNPTVSGKSHPFDDRLERGYDDDLPF